MVGDGDGARVCRVGGGGVAVGMWWGGWRWRWWWYWRGKLGTLVAGSWHCGRMRDGILYIKNPTINNFVTYNALIKQNLGGKIRHLNGKQKELRFMILEPACYVHNLKVIVVE